MTAVLSPRAVTLIETAPSPAFLAARGLKHLASEHYDPTRWMSLESTRWCVGCEMAHAAGFRPNHAGDPNRAHTGDLWWTILDGLFGDVRIRGGYSMFAPEAEPEAIAEQLLAIMATNPDRVAV